MDKIEFNKCAKEMKYSPSTTSVTAQEKSDLMLQALDHVVGGPSSRIVYKGNEFRPVDIRQSSRRVRFVSEQPSASKGSSIELEEDPRITFACDAFYAVDKSKTGYISLGEARAIFDCLGNHINQSKKETFLKNFEDTNMHINTISFHSFHELTMVLIEGNQTKRLQRRFYKDRIIVDKLVDEADCTLSLSKTLKRYNHLHKSTICHHQPHHSLPFAYLMQSKEAEEERKHGSISTLCRGKEGQFDLAFSDHYST